jgi:hypothetical protein
VEPAPFRVPPDVDPEAVVLEAAAGDEPALVVDELLELDPHAARPKMVAIATATALMRLLTLTLSP